MTLSAEKQLEQIKKSKEDRKKTQTAINEYQERLYQVSKQHEEAQKRNKEAALRTAWNILYLFLLPLKVVVWGAIKVTEFMGWWLDDDDTGFDFSKCNISDNKKKEMITKCSKHPTEKGAKECLIKELTKACKK